MRATARNKMKLDIKNWKEFEVGRLFRLEPTKGIVSDDLIKGKDVPYIGAKHDTNGYIMMCQREDYENWISKGNCIVFIQLGAGSAGYVNYLPTDFIGMNGKTICGYIDGVLNSYIGLFLETILCQERPKYSFGRSWTGNRLKDTKVALPIKYNDDNTPYIDENRTYSDEGYIPDWQFMEDYIKSLHHKPITTKVNNSNIPELNIHLWEWFSMGKLFDIKKGKRLTSADQEEGNNNYVGAIDSNNGIANYIGQAPIHEANTISLSYNGSVGEAFYQSEPYWATDDVNALYSRYSGFNKQIGLFMATVIRQEKYKFSYGRKWTLENMNSTDIKLPIQMDSNGKPVIDDNRTYSDNGYTPDWQFMEDYINSLPYSDRI